MIVWLASYPKSGNTLLRAILSSYFFSNDGIFNFKQLNNIVSFPSKKFFDDIGINTLTSSEKEIFENYINAQKKFLGEKKNSIKFLKTHSSLCNIENYSFTNLNLTLGVIYVVRDPRTTILSYCHHFNLTIDKALINFLSPSGTLDKKANLKTYVNTWNLNYNSWKNIGETRYLLIKYEDLVKDKDKVIKQVFNFLEKLTNSKFNINQDKMNNVIESTSFKRMQELEQKFGFHESSVNSKGEKITFFNTGPKNEKKLILDNINKLKIEKNFEKEMLELGYI